MNFIPKNASKNKKYKMTKQERDLLVQVTDLAIQISALKKECEMLKKENEFLKQLLLKEKNESNS